MSDSCENKNVNTQDVSARYRLILWVALVLNAVMFFVEFLGGKSAESNALLADSIDFFGDAANYGLSLFVLSGSLLVRSRTAWLKGVCMALFGFFVIGRALWSIQNGATPEPFTMGWIGLLALIVNVAVAAMLFAYRTGDANMRSVWLCSRNDAVGNIAVMFAGLAVWYFTSKWPDLIVAIGMGVLALSSAWQVLQHANAEMNEHHTD
jgi:Co/Zn/Cd efflux system component